MLKEIRILLHTTPEFCGLLTAMVTSPFECLQAEC